MRNKLIRQLTTFNSERLIKDSSLGERKRQGIQDGNSLKHLTECMIQVSQQIKEIKIKFSQYPQQAQTEATLRKGILLGQRMEKRFQDVNLPIPKLAKNAEEEEREEEILSWLTEVCKTVFSIGFNLYETGVLEINKVKAYCSENVLRNLVYFSRQNQLTEKQMESINKFLEKDLLPYFCQKYPESEQAETSSKFTSDLIERDGMEGNDYDLVYKSKVGFSFQENGNYNLQIMKFLNYIISLPNKLMAVNQDEEGKQKTKGKKQKALNELFFEDMESIFKMVQVENNTINMKKYNPKNPVPFQWSVDTSSEKEKQEYQQKVKSYTSYQIGQKLSKNFKPFSDLEIQSGNLTLKNAEIIRVLTKWCEELQKCYQDKFMLERETPFRMKDGSQNYLNIVYRISDQLKKHKQQLIDKMRSQISKNNYKHQSQLLTHNTHKQISILSESEASVGQFASYIFKNNQDYLVKYLNVLIHGITMSAKNLEYQNQLPRDEIAQLITFNIGDLMRCKCSSKENQIIALYKEIQRRHKQPNSGIKIIRVKNRLNKGNKDILMNLLYTGEMVVEMQLAIKSDKSKFIECSYNFNHYLYELKRAQFGPIMEMCNVWVSKDLKAQFYLEKVEKLNKRKKKKGKYTQIEGTCCEYAKKIIRLPFRCSDCSCFYFSPGQAERNIYCEECDRQICFLCQLESSWKERKRLLKNIKELKDQDLDQIQIVQKIPKTGGMLINLKAHEKKGLLFLTVQQNNENHLFQCRQGTAKLIVKLNSQIFSEEFLQQNLIVSSQKIQRQVAAIYKKEQPIILRKFIQKYMKDAYNQEKSTIILPSKNIKQQNLIIPNIEYFPNVTTINFSDNFELCDFSKAVQKFPNTEEAVLNNINATKVPEKMWGQIKILRLEDNKISEISNLTQCQKLQQLYLRQNQLKILPNEIENWSKIKILNLRLNSLANLPPTIGSLKFLQKLDLCLNRIQQLPIEIGGMVSLKYLNIDHNTLEQIPQSIGELKNLKQLNCSGNSLKKPPSSIGKLTQLKKFYLNMNKLTELPPEIGNLRQLTHLYLQSNTQLVLPEQLGQLKSLQEVHMQKNDISFLPSSISQLKNLKIFNAESAKGNLPKSIGCLLSVSTLDLSQIKCGQIPEQIGQLRKLENLDASDMGLSVLPDSIGKLQSLSQLKLLTNKLTSLPESFGELRYLKRVDLSSNKLGFLPESIGKLSHLTQLNLTNNQLKSLPETFGQLESLKILTLDINKFEIFPEHITRLESLQDLYIAVNRLKSLPQSICQLIYLNKLDLQQNQLQQLPSKLPEMKSLQNLYLDGNRNLTVSQPIFKCKSLKCLGINIVDSAAIEAFALKVAASTNINQLIVYKKGGYMDKYELPAKIYQLTQGKVKISLKQYSR